MKGYDEYILERSALAPDCIRIYDVFVNPLSTYKAKALFSVYGIGSFGRLNTRFII